MTDMQDHLKDYALGDVPPRPSHDTLAVLAAAPFTDLPSAQRLDLQNLVEREIVPRLRGRPLALAAVARPTAIKYDLCREAAIMADLLLVNDRLTVCDRIETLCDAEGCSLERIFLELLAPTAAHLRNLWADDHCGFAEVTLAISNLQSVVRQFAPAFRAERRTSHLIPQELGPRAVIVAPRLKLDVGTTMFGLVMLAEFFRRSGWEPWVEADLAGPALRTAIRDQWFDIAEVLVQDDKHLDGVAAGIKTIRRSSLNRSIGVIVCGQVSIDHPELARLVGADLTSSDPKSSLIQARRFVSLATSPLRLR